MKILEAQSATLTNYEVYQHLKSIEDKSGIIQGLDKNGEKIPDVPKMRPGNLKTIKKEVSRTLMQVLEMHLSNQILLL